MPSLFSLVSLLSKPTFFINTKHGSLNIFNICCQPVHWEWTYQERGSRNGKWLLVQICTTKEKQDISSVLRLVKLQELGQFPQLVQVWRELQPVGTSNTDVGDSPPFTHWSLCTSKCLIMYDYKQSVLANAMQIKGCSKLLRWKRAKHLQQ